MNEVSENLAVTPVWCFNSSNKFSAGIIKENLSFSNIELHDGGSHKLFTVYLDDGGVAYKSLDEVYPRDAQFGFPDNCSLAYLNLANVVQNITERFRNTFKEDPYGIYTFTGSVLIAVNPYCANPSLYDENTITSFIGKPVSSVPPHPFAIAEAAYSALLQRGQSQSIIINGESGAGKTECSKHVLKYLAYNSCRNSKDNRIDGIEDRVLQTNPLLEAFGNATTVRNINSSRFGKFIRLHFSPLGKLIKGSISTYLLAKSRVCDVPVHEKNYHIFYWLCRDATPQERQSCHIKKIEDYRYLDSQCTVEMSSALDDVRKAMKAVNILEEDQQKGVFKTLTIILTLGNLEFTEGFRHADNTDNVTIIRQPHALHCSDGPRHPPNDPSTHDLHILHSLLELDTITSKNNFELALTSKRICDTRSNLTPYQAKQTVDALARHLYQKLFDYIVEQINSMLKSTMIREDVHEMDGSEGVPASNPTNQSSTPDHDSSNYVGVLDIFGFEDMVPYSKNGFEQLCINYANERLHTFFLEQLVTRDTKVYLSEGIAPPADVSKHVSAGSIACCLAISNSIGHGVPGIFQLLDEASLAPVVGTKDTYFCQKVNTTLGRNETTGFSNVTGGVVLTKKSFNVSLNFTVRHFAGDIVYTAEGFNQQNLDCLPKDLQTSLECCNNQFITQLLFSQRNDTVSSSFFQKPTLDLKNGCNATDIPLAPKRFTHVSPFERGSSMKRKTLAAVFCSQVSSFIKCLEETSSWFIRCIKSNDLQSSTEWDQIRVREQLETGGMLVAVQWMGKGYPCRVSYNDLWERYSDLLPPVMRNSINPKAFTELVLLVVGTRTSDFQLGHSLAFFRFGALHDIEMVKKIATSNECCAIAQRIYKFWIHKRLKRCLIAVRCAVRTLFLLHHIRRHKLAIEAQAYYHRFFIVRRRCALRIQRFWRGYLQRQKEKAEALCIISNALLNYTYRRRLLRKKESVRSLQSITFVTLARHKYFESLRSVQCLQSVVLRLIAVRRFSTVSTIKRQKKAALLIQRCWRRCRLVRRDTPPKRPYYSSDNLEQLQRSRLREARFSIIDSIPPNNHIIYHQQDSVSSNVSVGADPLYDVDVKTPHPISASFTPGSPPQSPFPSQPLPPPRGSLSIQDSVSSGSRRCSEKTSVDTASTVQFYMDTSHSASRKTLLSTNQDTDVPDMCSGGKHENSLGSTRSGRQKEQKAFSVLSRNLVPIVRYSSTPLHFQSLPDISPRCTPSVGSAPRVQKEFRSQFHTDVLPRGCTNTRCCRVHSPMNRTVTHETNSYPAHYVDRASLKLPPAFSSSLTYPKQDCPTINPYEIKPSFDEPQNLNAQHCEEKAEISALVNMPGFEDAVLQVVKEKLFPLRPVHLCPAVFAFPNETTPPRVRDTVLSHIPERSYTIDSHDSILPIPSLGASHITTSGVDTYLSNSKDETPSIDASQTGTHASCSPSPQPLNKDTQRLSLMSRYPERRSSSSLVESRGNVVHHEQCGVLGSKGDVCSDSLSTTRQTGYSRRVSWLFMEGILGDDTSRDQMPPSVSAEKAFDTELPVSALLLNPQFPTQEEEAPSPLLTHRGLNPKYVTGQLKTSTARATPLRRSILITDDILMANEAPAPSSQPSLKRNAASSIYYAQSRIPRFNRKKRLLAEQSTTKTNGSYSAFKVSTSRSTSLSSNTLSSSFGPSMITPNKHLASAHDCSVSRETYTSNSISSMLHTPHVTQHCANASLPNANGRGGKLHEEPYQSCRSYISKLPRLV